jgi:hypothetical protein
MDDCKLAARGKRGREARKESCKRRAISCEQEIANCRWTTANWLLAENAEGKRGREAASGERLAVSRKLPTADGRLRTG